MSYNDLYYRLSYNPTVGVEEVQALIDKYPNQVKEGGYDGNLPLHEAMHGASLEVLQLLIKEYPDAAKMKNKDGQLPLHLAIDYGRSKEVLQLLIDEYPDALKEKDQDGRLPLHVAVSYGAPKEVIELLIKEYPNAVREKNDNGHLPLYWAVRQGASAEVLQLLIDEYPDALREKNEDGHLPLYWAVLRGISKEAIELLIKGYPDALKEKDDNGHLPLYWAVRQGASAEVVRLLINEYPDAVREKTGDGDLPLHYAVRVFASKEVIQLLMKEYPDAVKEKDQYGNSLLSRPQIKEIYDRVVTVVQNLTRSKGLLGDNPKGKDLLGVEEEIQAIAETIAMKDLQPPFVVGILGGWGSGKTFTFNLIREYLKKIQNYDLATEAVKDNFPYVGHIYPIVFSAWAYAKACLWASIMHCILTELNDQLDLEEVIGQELLKEGVSVLELMDEFTTSGEMEYLKKTVQDERVQQALRKWKSKDGNITKALINATNSNYEKEVKDLAEKKQQLLQITLKKQQQLAWEDVIAEANTTFSPEIKNLLEDAYKQYAAENPNDPVPQTVDAAIEHLNRWKGMFGPFLRLWDLFWTGKLSPLRATVFLSSLVIAVVLPLVFDKVEGALTAIGPLVSAIVLKFNDAREKLRSAEDVITKVASEMHLDKEQVQKALEAANKVQLHSDNDEERQQDNIEMLNAEINALEDSVWLRKGDSLKKVVGDRLGSSNYEERLGVVHQAQKDLQHISDAMLSNNKNGSFPRGDPRIVLFIDDLDRCPPEKVVETLEAVQLLVNTDLFVVVLAIDAKYVTLCLEKKYVDILHPERHPSGLDYIEKIIQLPYRVPPISAEYMKSYLQEQMNPEEEEDRHELSALTEVSFVGRLSSLVTLLQKYFFASNEDHVTQEGSSAEASPLPYEYMKSYLQPQMNAEKEVSPEPSDHNVSRPRAVDGQLYDDSIFFDCFSGKEEAKEHLDADENTCELSAGNEVLEEKEEEGSSAEVSNEAKSPGPNNDDSKSFPGQQKVESPISTDNKTSVTTNEGVPEETDTAQSGSKAPMVSIPTKELKFTWKELESLDDACVFSGVAPRSGKRLVNVFKLMKIIWLRRDQTPDEDTPHEVSMKDACVWILALCASNSRSVRREMCKVLAKIETATSRPVDCGNLKSFIRNTLGEIESEQVDDSPLTMIYDEKCSGIFEKVEWKDDEEWKLVKKDLRLVRSFSFVGEYNESVKVIDRGT